MKKYFLLPVLLFSSKLIFAQAYSADFKDGTNIKAIMLSKTPATANRLRITTPFPLFTYEGENFFGFLQASWLQPGKFLLEGVYGYGGQSCKVLYFLAKSNAKKPLKVPLKFEYEGNNTVNVYSIKIPDAHTQVYYGLHAGLEHRNYNVDGFSNNVPLNTVEVTAGVGLSAIKNWRAVVIDSSSNTSQKMNHTRIFSLYADMVIAPYHKYTPDEELNIPLNNIYSPIGFRAYIESYFDADYNKALDFGFKYILGVEMSCSKSVGPIVGFVLYFGFLHSKNDKP